MEPLTGDFTCKAQGACFDSLSASVVDFSLKFRNRQLFRTGGSLFSYILTFIEISLASLESIPFQSGFCVCV